jgi:hypothetical protein
MSKRLLITSRQKLKDLLLRRKSGELICHSLQDERDIFNIINELQAALKEFIDGPTTYTDYGTDFQPVTTRCIYCDVEEVKGDIETVAIPGGTKQIQRMIYKHEEDCPYSKAAKILEVR